MKYKKYLIRNMLAIWFKFCPIFFYLPYEKTNIKEKSFISLNEQVGKSANIEELESKIDKLMDTIVLFIRYLRVS